MKNENLVTLEQIIDSDGVSATLGTIADICREKAAHIRENWQDVPLAKEWERIAANIEKLSTKVNARA